MKKYILYTVLGATTLIVSCTKKFGDINTDPKQYSPSTFDANYFLSNAQANYASEIMGAGGPILFQSGWIQVFSIASGVGDFYTNADKYLASGNTNSYVQSSWNNGYRAASLANEILRNKITNPNTDSNNVKGVATIMKVLSIQYITDTYGDCPYSQAFGAREQVTLPVYDKQQALYSTLLNDLDKALTTMDATKKGPSADVSSLAGDVGKWKRFGYSLMLRLAMRLTKADAATAKTWAEKAYASGTLNMGEDVYLKRQNANGYGNGNITEWLVPSDFYEVRWSKTLIDYLRSVNDPRLGIIAEVPKTGFANNSNQKLAGDKTPAHQNGQPNGYDMSGGATDISHAPGYPGTSPADPSISGDVASPIGKYSRPAIDVYANRDLPLFVLTYAETELLLAEGAVRGWNVGTTALAHYKNAVSAALQSLNTFEAGVISQSTADAYALSHPLDISSTTNALSMINTQYWATTGTLFNFGESWLNWKRSGYPVLTPINYSGNFSNGVIPRRQVYPSGESTSNPDNYNAAVGGLSGGDAWSAKVWWDK